MKKIFFFTTVSFIICSAFNKAANSNSGYPNKNLCADYRDAYVGSYFCNSTSPKIRLYEAPIIIRDTVSVNVTKDRTDSILQFTIGSNILKFKLKNGILSSYPEEDNHKNGNFFASDSLRLYISLGRTISINLKGKKNKLLFCIK